MTNETKTYSIEIQAIDGNEELRKIKQQNRVLNDEIYALQRAMFSEKLSLLDMQTIMTAEDEALFDEWGYDEQGLDRCRLSRADYARSLSEFGACLDRAKAFHENDLHSLSILRCRAVADALLDAALRHVADPAEIPFSFDGKANKCVKEGILSVRQASCTKEVGLYFDGLIDGFIRASEDISAECCETVEMLLSQTSQALDC